MIGLELGGEPSWLSCLDCGKETMRERCYECSEARYKTAARRDAERIAEASIDERYKWARLDYPELKHRVRSRMDPAIIARDYVLKANMVLLSGPAGCGKTSLAVACMRERLAGSYFVDACDLAISTQQHSLGDGESAMFDRARAARLLVIDEFKWPGTEMRAKELERLLNARHASQRLTIVTTALDAGQILQHFGDGVHRRLCEKSSALSIRLGVETKAQAAE